MKQNLRALNILLLSCLAFLAFSRAKAQHIIPYDGAMPVPTDNNNRLFYLQRTIDINTVIYEMNYGADGQIDKNRPVRIYWIDFANAGKITQLTFIQSRLAYGLDVVELDGREKIYEINLVSYKKIKMYLMPTGHEGAYQTHLSIKGRQALLTNILVKITGGTFLKPIIAYIELIGKDLKTGEELVEKIKPSG